MNITLTADQEAAFQEIGSLLTTTQSRLVICGGAGVGKTTLMRYVIDQWSSIASLSCGAIKDYQFVMTATTNKAADALSTATGLMCQTIQSFLGLRVQRSMSDGRDYLVDTGKYVEDTENLVVVIDESSFIDDTLYTFIETKLKHAKVIFMGDPNQLKPVNSQRMPAFEVPMPTVYLNQVVRQAADSDLLIMCQDLRKLVETNVLTPIGVNGIDIAYLERSDFEQAFVQDVLKAPAGSVRALAWRNEHAIHFNNLVALARNGHSDIVVGDLVNVNKQYKVSRNFRFPTDSTFTVTEMNPVEVDEYGIAYRAVKSSYNVWVDQVLNVRAWKAQIAQLNKDAKYTESAELEKRYADLRLTFASTVNKAQGSTYESVYVDLDDIGRCRDKDQVNRMLYVAASRAKHKVVFTGDI